MRETFEQASVQTPIPNLCVLRKQVSVRRVDASGLTILTSTGRSNGCHFCDRQVHEEEAADDDNVSPDDASGPTICQDRADGGEKHLPSCNERASEPQY